MTTTNFSVFDIQFFAGESGDGAGSAEGAEGRPISVTTNAGPAPQDAAGAGSVTSLTQTPTTDGGQTSAAPASGEPGTQTPLADPKAKAPESYQPFTLPAEMPAENPQVKEALAEAGGLFRELGLTQEQGQRLIDLHAKHWLGGMLNQQELFEQELDRRVAQWGEQTKAHPEFGGTRLNESLASVRRAIAHLGGEKLAHALDKETGLINHPEVFAAFARAGKLFAEDQFVGGSPAGTSPNSPSAMAARVYPGMTRN